VRRLCSYTVIALATVTLLACGRTPPAAEAPVPAAGDQPAAPAAAAPADAEEDRIRKTTIWMAKNDPDAGHRDPEVVAVCMGTVTVDKLRKVGRKQKVRWRIKNDDDGNDCPTLDVSAIQLRFEDEIWVDQRETNSPNPPTFPPVSVLTAQGGRIEARVYYDDPIKNPPTVRNGSYKYWVVYKTMQASPDPEVDVFDDCGICGPGGP